MRQHSPEGAGATLRLVFQANNELAVVWIIILPLTSFFSSVLKVYGQQGQFFYYPLRDEDIRV